MKVLAGCHSDQADRKVWQGGAFEQNHPLGLRDVPGPVPRCGIGEKFALDIGPGGSIRQHHPVIGQKPCKSQESLVTNGQIEEKRLVYLCQVQEKGDKPARLELAFL